MMFSVRANGVEIYNTAKGDKDMELDSPYLELEESCAGSFAFRVPPVHPYYNDIERFKTRIHIYRDNKLYWEGRVLEEEVDFLNNRKLYCEGALSFLNDTRQPQREYRSYTWSQILNDILIIHNSKVDADKMFKQIGNPNWNVGIFDKGMEYPPDQYYTTQYQSTLEILNDIAEAVDGRIRLQFYEDENGNITRQIDILDKDSAEIHTLNQKIVFGKNLLDFTRSYDMSNLVTALLPLGKKTAGGKNIGDKLNPGENTIKDNDGNDVLQETVYVNNYRCGYFHKLTGAIISDDQFPDGTACEEHHKEFMIHNVQQGNTYYINSRLPRGKSTSDDQVCFYALKVGDNPYDDYTLKEVGSSIGYDDLTQAAVEIPAGVTDLWVWGDTRDVELEVYRGNNLPDGMETYTTLEGYTKNSAGETVHDGSLYLKAVSRDVTTIDQYGNATTVTVDPLLEFGYIEKTIEFDDVDEPSELYQKALQYLTDYQFDQMQIEVNAVDMKTLGATDVDAIDIFKQIRAVSPIHGLDRIFPVTKLGIYLNQPDKNVYTLGSTVDNSLTETTNAIDDDLFAKIAETPKRSEVLQAAKNEAMALINTSDKGVINFIRDENNNITEMTMVNTENLEDATKAWRWNWGGLAFGDYDPTTGALSNPKDGILNNGSIVADRITAGTMYADRIKGGDLTLGGYSDSSSIDPATGEPIGYGRIIINDEDAVPRITIGKDGMFFGEDTGGFNRGLKIFDGEIWGYRDGKVKDPQTRFAPATTMDMTYLGGSDESCYLETGNLVLILKRNGKIFINESGSGVYNMGYSGSVYVGDKTLHFVHGMFTGYD